MTIEKNSFKVARFQPEYRSPHSKDTRMSSDDEDSQRRNSVSAVESDDDEFDDCDSGAGSDDFDLLELGGTGEEFCQLGNQTCSIPYELYDLPGLKDVLSMDVWNEVLTEEERFGLSKYLPDMDQENFVRTMKELFSGDNLHFGSPVDKLFEMLKGGLCEPRVALYRQGLSFFHRRKHYHNMRKHQNSLVNNICQIRDAWQNCRGYSIDEKLRVLNIMKSQKSLMNENMEEIGSESSDKEESGDGLWSTKVKDRKLGQKASRYSTFGVGPALVGSSRGRKTTMESTKYGKQNSKGTLKLPGMRTKELAEPFPSAHHGVELKSGPHLGPRVSRHMKALGYESSSALRMNEQVFEDDDGAETMYEVAVHRDRSYPRLGVNDRPGASKWRKYEGPRAEEDMDSLTGIPISARNEVHALGRNKGINKLSDIKVLTAKPNAKNIYEGGKKVVKHTENHQHFSGEYQMKFGKGQKSNLSVKGSQIEMLDGNDPTWHSTQGGLFPSDLNAKKKKGKIGREVVDLNEHGVMHDYRAKSLQDNLRASSMQNGKRGVSTARSEDTDSDSFEQLDEDDNPLMRSKWAYPSGVPDTKKPEMSKRNKKQNYATLDGSSHYNEHLQMMKLDHQKGKMHEIGHFNIFPSNNMDKNFFPGPVNVIGNDGRQQFYPLGRNGHVEGNYGNSFHMSSLKPPLMQERRRKGEVRHDFGLPQPNYIQDSNLEDDLYWTRPVSSSHDPERSDLPLIGCNTSSKKRKLKEDFTHMHQQDNNDYLHADTKVQLNDVSSPRKRGKNKLDDASDALDEGISEPPVVEMEDVVEVETKPQKKSFPLITPTVHTGFSFSIIHLLSAVRVALVTLLPEDSSETGKEIENADAEKSVKEEQDIKQGDVNLVNSNPDTSVLSNQANVPSLTVQEIVNRVRSNPGDPCILETQEPLQDLIRGVLKIFSSRTAPLGAKGWKPLVVYEKSTKSWSWIGPLSNNLSDSDVIEEVTSPDAWGLPYKMLVKLVDSFANWLKNSQETLQQIGSLPAPPLTLMQNNLDEKERFKDLRAQKSLSTISPSSDEVKAYFRQEEVLRYLIPDRAFSYTAVDGKKSIVAPLRRCGGKPTSKARDHFMLKRDRPPHVTILCLVRDAAARLPGSIGTRADVCTLIRDSQYIVEDVSDAQVNQVVSGALDRLHYERDPCVQFDTERKLWAYLHREREEEDFEDDGTSSTKKWRRQKKDANEPAEPGAVTVVSTEPTGDFVSDPNAKALCADDQKILEQDYLNGNDQVEDNGHGLDNGPTAAMWDGVGLKSLEENKLFCQEGSTNQDFDEAAFGGEPPV